MTSSNFAKMGIRDVYCERLKEQEIIHPTKVQEAAITKLLEGKDLIVQSQTGTGKTLAYLLPILERIHLEQKHVQAVVLCPTQELASQVVEVARKMGESDGLRAQLLIGGAALKRQVERLKKHPHLVVGTPGRIAELIRMGKLKMHHVKTLIIDEADQVLALSSTVEVEKVISSTLADRQLAFFSATIPSEIAQLAKKRMKEAEFLQIEPKQKVAPLIEHVSFLCEARDKIDVLKKVIRAYKPKACIVFLHHTDRIAEVENKLSYSGFSVKSLYGDSYKAERSQAIEQFRKGKVQCLIATDVAARGLDLAEVSLIIHFDPPFDEEQYIHRAGRTGRAGQSGTSVLLLAPSELRDAKRISKRLDIQLMEKKLYNGEVVDVTSDQRKSQKTRKTKKYRKEHPSEGSHKTSKSTRQQVRKNKGAPKWLKNKS